MWLSSAFDGTRSTNQVQSYKKIGNFTLFNSKKYIKETLISS